MESISRAIRDKIASAAHYRCEYCQTAREISGAQMHIEHIIPLSRGGRSDESNLCLACAWCNSYKWVQTHGFDPETHIEPTQGTGSARQWRPCTPAMVVGLTDHVWTLREVLLFRVPPWSQPVGV